MAQTDQQRQNESVKMVHVHFRWMGSNALIASLKADDPMCSFSRTGSDLYLLRQWLASKVGLPHKSWFQMTLYCGKQRLTHDVLLGAHLKEDARTREYRYSLMPHIGEACQSFVTQLTQETTADIVVHVTQCSDADCKAAVSLAVWPVADVWKKYCNNVAFMFNAVTQWSGAFGHASLEMRQNELVAMAALKNNKGNAQLVSPVLWNKPSFVLKAAALHYLSKYLGPAVRDDAATMLCLIKMDSQYFDAATSKTDFEFQCLAVSANPNVLYKLDKLTQAKVAERNCSLSLGQAGFKD